MRRTRRTLFHTLLLAHALLLAAAPAQAAAQTAAAPQGTPAQQKGGEDSGPAGPPARDLTLLTVCVTDDYGRYVTGLGREGFSVYEGDRQRELVYFDAAEAPQSVAVVLDVSHPAKNPALDAARGALLSFARQGHPANEYSVFAFGRQARLLTDWTRDTAALAGGMNDLSRAGGGTGGRALYDALAAAAEKAAGGRQPRRIVILFSDGRDTGSETKASDLRERLRRSGVTLYAVRVTGADPSEFQTADLEELARVSGGLAVFPRTRAEMESAFERIALELHSLYTVGFRTDGEAADGRWHKIRVKVQPPPKWPRLHVRTREGYYAAGSAGN